MIVKNDLINRPVRIKEGFANWWASNHAPSNSVPFQDGDSVRAFCDAKAQVYVCEYDGNEASGAIVPLDFIDDEIETLRAENETLKTRIAELEQAKSEGHYCPTCGGYRIY